MPPSPVDDSEPSSPARRKITLSLTSHVAAIVEECGAKALFVHVDALAGHAIEFPEHLRDRVFYVAKTLDENRLQEERHVRHIRVPNVALSRVGQIQIALLVALSRGEIERGDVVVFLAGAPGSGFLDTLVVTEIGSRFESFLIPGEGADLTVDPAVLERVIEIAVALGSEGREGRAVGALFVVGDSDRVISLSRQLILNPFTGYPEESRNILDPAVEETVKELATVDGAFVVRRDGVILSAGTYLKTASQDEFEMPKGLGARHHAAAGITSVSDAVAVTISESTGTVTVFRGGQIVTSIDRPLPARES